MGFSLNANLFLSRIVRRNASNGITGASLILNTGLPEKPRKIESVSKNDTNNSSGGGLIGRIISTVKNFFGWVWTGVQEGFRRSVDRLLSSLFTTAFGYLIQTFNTLWTFDWNASDKELQDLIKSQETLLGAAWGSFAGQGVGWIASLGVGYGMGHRCPVIGSGSLARLIASRVAEEAGEELALGLRSALQVTLGVATRSFILTRYADVRRWIKSLPQDRLAGIVGAPAANWLKNEWGAENGPNMSMAETLDNTIEKIPSQFWRTFVEELIEESWDSFIEGGYIVAQELDSALAANRLQKKLGEGGTQRTIEVVPDKEAKDEKLRYFAVPQDTLIPQIQNDINQHRLLYNRDVGQIIGKPESTWGIANTYLRQLTIIFRSNPAPPWRDSTGKRAKEASYSIPDAKIGLTWNDIKLAAKPFNWGKYRATARLNNRRQMAVYGATPAEAKDTLRDLLRLTTAEIIALSVTEEDERPVRLRKTTTRMYPAFATLISRRSNVSQNGIVTLDDKLLEQKLYRFPLWVDSEPNDFQILQ